MFKIGQKVVYITGINMPKGSIHIVSDIHFSECGCVDIAINGKKLEFRPSNNHPVMCAFCNKVYITKDYLDGDSWDAESFRLLDETFAEGILEQITQQIEEEELILSK